MSYDYDYRIAFYKDIRRMFKKVPDGKKVEAVARVLHETMRGAQHVQARLAKAWGTRPYILRLAMDGELPAGFAWGNLYVMFGDGPDVTMWTGHGDQARLCLRIVHGDYRIVDNWPLDGPDKEEGS
jgi:hypothetical protein